MLLNGDYLENNLFNASKIQDPLKHAANVTSSLSNMHKYNLTIEMFSVDPIKKKTQ